MDAGLTVMVGDIEKLAACLAVNCIGVMALQATLGAGKIHLGWSEDRLGQLHKERDAGDHDDD